MTAAASASASDDRPQQLPLEGRILTQDLTVVFDLDSREPTTALERINVHIRPKEFVGIVGSNASGKSTLLRVIAGTQHSTSGYLYIDDADVTDKDGHVRAQRVAMVTQSPQAGCVPNLTVEENLCLALLKGRRLTPKLVPSTALRQQIFSTLDGYRIPLRDELDRLPGELSGGQRQMLVMAMALAQRPSILLLDEHTAALDLSNRTVVNELTTRIAGRREMTIVMVSHNLDEAIRMTERLLVLRQGRIVKDVKGPERQRLTSRGILDDYFA
jgi:putative ABC transport system ATP-binding protein